MPYASRFWAIAILFQLVKPMSIMVTLRWPLFDSEVVTCNHMPFWDLGPWLFVIECVFCMLIQSPGSERCLSCV